MEKVFDRTWTLGGSTTATTGAGTAAQLYGTLPTEWTVFWETPYSSQSTATVRLEVALSSTGRWGTVGTSVVSLSSAAGYTEGFTGPYDHIRPYLITLGSTATVVKCRVLGV